MWIKISEKYSVNDTGYVKNNNTNKIKSFHLTGSGYKRVQLYNNGEPEYVFVHKLVYETFTSKIPNDSVVIHNDGDITNNRLDNLKCVKKKDRPKVKKRYRRYSNETRQEVYKQLLEGVSVQQLSDTYGISLQYLYRVKNTELWNDY